MCLGLGQMLGVCGEISSDGGNITFPSSPSYSHCTYANTVHHFVGML